MSTLRLKGTVSGFADLTANANAGAVLVEMPTRSGSLVDVPIGTVVANGSLLIGNTVSGTFDVATLTQGAGITITNDKGSITVTSTGASDQFARDTANGAFLKANGAVQSGFVTVNIAGQSDVVADSNADTLTLVAGTGVVLTTDAANDKITIATIVTPGGNSFSTVNVAGQSDVVADSNADTLVLVGGTGIAITTDAPTDTITITATGLATSIDPFARTQANAAFDKANSAEPVGTGSDHIFYENDQVVTGNYTITTGKSAMSAGPITLNPSIVVTIPANSRWVVV